MSESEGSIKSEVLAISQDDLEELELLTTIVLSAWQQKSPHALFNVYQRQKHIINRIRGIFEE